MQNDKKKIKKPATPAESPNETEELLLICKVIDSWGAEQKERALKYLFSKYKQFL